MRNRKETGRGIRYYEHRIHSSWRTKVLGRPSSPSVKFSGYFFTLDFFFKLSFESVFPFCSFAVYLIVLVTIFIWRKDEIPRSKKSQRSSINPILTHDARSDAYHDRPLGHSGAYHGQTASPYQSRRTFLRRNLLAGNLTRNGQGHE